MPLDPPKFAPSELTCKLVNSLIKTVASPNEYCFAGRLLGENNYGLVK